MFVFAQGASQPRFVRALPVVLTASLADTTLILLAVLGVSVVVLTFSWVETTLVVGGVLFLTYLGWTNWRAESESGEGWGDGAEWTPRRQVIFALSVSLLNPHAILDTIGVIGTSSLAYVGSGRVAFASACILVSWSWFFLLAVAGRTLGKIGRVRKMLNRLSAVVMWGSAAYLVYAFAGS
jgi:L-lysine exporter family protein LysE/ArgO